MLGQMGGGNVGIGREKKYRLDRTYDGGSKQTT